MVKMMMKHGLQLLLTRFSITFRFFNKLEKDVFKTAFELNQNWIIELSGTELRLSLKLSRLIYFCQLMFIKELHKIHFDAWKKGLKALLL